MTTKIILSDEEKQTLNNAINIIYEYQKHSTETGAEFIKTLSVLNSLTEFLNKAIKDN